MADFKPADKNVEALYYQRTEKGRQILDRLPYNLVTYDVESPNSASYVEPIAMVNPLGENVQAETVNKLTIAGATPYEPQVFFMP